MSQRQPKTSYWQDAPLPREQIVLFTTTLEDRIPHDHPVRLLDEILERIDWCQWEAEYHGSFGQPPIHPSVLCKILLFSMIRRIRSSRQMEYQLNHSIDFIWLASGRSIDHVTLSNFRRRHTKALKELYRQVVQLAVGLGVAKLGELCIDGTRVLANANRYKTWTTAKLEKLLAELDAQIAQALDGMEAVDNLDDLFDDGQAADRLPEELRDLQARRQQLGKALETVQQMDEDRRANGIDPVKKPARLPKTDTDSRILPSKEGGYAANYTPMAVTETENGFIVGADVVIGNVEHDQLTTMIDTIEQEHNVHIDTVLGDTAYSSGPNLTAMEERGTELLSPLTEPKCPDNPALREDLTEPVAADAVDRLPINPQTKRFDKSAFVYNEETDSYFCPAGKELPRSGTEKKKVRGNRVSLQQDFLCDDCAGCPLAARCRANPEAKKGRKISHDTHDAARRRHRARMETAEAKERFKKRQHYGETQFGVLKTTLDLRRFLLRGVEGVQTEWLWGCTAFNLKKLMGLIGRVRAESNETADSSLT
jgi:transposase